MNFRPLQDRIVVKRLEASDEKTASGLIIPDSAKEKPQEGEVVAVGNGKRDDKGVVHPVELKAGDRILFGKYSGSDIKMDGQEYMVMREDEVLLVIDNVGKKAKA
jgi:chaperonin GroES